MSRRYNCNTLLTYFQLLTYLNPKYCFLFQTEKGLTLTYQKMLVLPMPDYAHRYALWRNLIVTAGGQILKWSDRFDLSSLTKVSDGYTAGHIKYAVDQTLTDRRVIQVLQLQYFGIKMGQKIKS